MALNVKNKIWLGTLFLFLLLLLTGGVGIYYIIHLKDQTKAVLQDNYESLSYSHAMQAQLDSLPIKHIAAIQAFDSALHLQEHNITEPGERVVTRVVRVNFEKLRSGNTSSEVTQQI